MNKQVSLVVLAVGIVMILYCVGASSPFGLVSSGTFAGSPAQKILAIFCAGAVFTSLGGYGLLRRPYGIFAR